MEGEGANKWKFMETAILNRFWQNDTENCLRDYFHLLKSPDFRLEVLRCAGSYSWVFALYFTHNVFYFLKI